MMTILIVFGAIGLTVQAFIGFSFFVSCIREKESRATVFALLQFLGMVFLLLGFLLLAGNRFFYTPKGAAVLIAGYVFAGAAAFLMLRKSGLNPRALSGTKGLIVGEVHRYDERKIVFARNRSLRPGSPQYQVFYQEHPEYKAYDEKRRATGGPMGNPGAIDGSRGDVNIAMTFASGNIPLFLGDSHIVKPKRHFALAHKFGDKPIEISPQEATRKIKGFAKRLGASLVGVTAINPLWVYSRRGEIFHDNWEDWGREIHLEHKYAVVFAEEMALDMVGTAPHTPTTIESMYNYAKGAIIATQLAAFIANLGYSATANHLRHYDALMVPLAVDAGLGELSRMGYLLTRELGPRVRLSAVTTDLPLVPDKPVDIGSEDFCRICKKCAVCCPSQSIPMGDQEEVNGSLRWKLNEQTCFEYWGKVGTDCNRCMMVCPWGHARTFPHKLIVAMITRNALARRIFSIMDDIFYGKQPKPKAGPHWTGYA